MAPHTQLPVPPEQRDMAAPEPSTADGGSGAQQLAGDEATRQQPSKTASAAAEQQAAHIAKPPQPGTKRKAAHGEAADVLQANARRKAMASACEEPSASKPAGTWLTLPELPAVTAAQTPSSAMSAAPDKLPIAESSAAVCGAAAVSALPTAELQSPHSEKTPQLERPGSLSPAIQRAAAAAVSIHQSLPVQLQPDVGLGDGGGGQCNGQRPNPGRGIVAGAPATVPQPPAPAAVSRPPAVCKYCALHGVTSAFSRTHRASCHYFNRCPCFRCRKLHLRNYNIAECARRKRQAVAALKRAAKV